MSAQPSDPKPSAEAVLVPVDAMSLRRWFKCDPCEVQWHDVDPVCWSCGTDQTSLSSHPRMRDQSGVETAVGTPIPRFRFNVGDDSGAAFG